MNLNNKRYICDIVLSTLVFSVIMIFTQNFLSTCLRDAQILDLGLSVPRLTDTPDRYRSTTLKELELTVAQRTESLQNSQVV
jgi:hypothetical protein